MLVTTLSSKQPSHPLQGLGGVLHLGLFLAYERNRGRGSFWQPYVDLLPEHGGCAWLMPPEELAEALDQAAKLVGEVSHVYILWQRGSESLVLCLTLKADIAFEVLLHILCVLLSKLCVMTIRPTADIE